MASPVRARWRNPLGIAAIGILPFAFISILFLYSVASILWRGLVPEGSFDREPLKRVLLAPQFVRGPSATAHGV